MPCKKFFSLRLEASRPARLHVDRVDGRNPFRTFDNLTQFTIRTRTGLGTETPKGTTLLIEPLRWPPPPYDAPMTISLHAQWPFGMDYYEDDDTSGHHLGRSFPGVDFVYNASAGTLSWNQQRYGGHMTGSVKFYETSPVWSIVLVLDPAAGEAAGGEMIVDGKDMTIPPKPGKP